VQGVQQPGGGKHPERRSQLGGFQENRRDRVLKKEKESVSVS
jgi:hypothetical protein